MRIQRVVYTVGINFRAVSQIISTVALLPTNSELLLHRQGNFRSGHLASSNLKPDRMLLNSILVPNLRIYMYCSFGQFDLARSLTPSSLMLFMARLFPILLRLSKIRSGQLASTIFLTASTPSRQLPTSSVLRKTMFIFEREAMP